MKPYKILLSAIFFAILVNANFYYADGLGSSSFGLTMILFLVYVFYLFVLIIQIIYCDIEKYKNKKRNISAIILLLILFAMYMKPTGLINKKRPIENCLLIAKAEGVANCMTVLKLKDKNEFTEKSVCFGIEIINGNYKILNDTIYFENIRFGRGNSDTSKYYEFALLKPSIFYEDKSKKDIVRYRNKKDTIGRRLWITKNELIFP